MTKQFKTTNEMQLASPYSEERDTLFNVILSHNGRNILCEDMQISFINIMNCNNATILFSLCNLLEKCLKKRQ